MQKQPLEIKAFPLIRLDLALHIVPRIHYLGFTLKGRRVLGYDGGLVHLQVQMNFDTTINCQLQHLASTDVREDVPRVFLPLQHQCPYRTEHNGGR
jgi:hypothetical protein